MRLWVIFSIVDVCFPFTKKQNISPSLGRDDLSRLGVAISKVSEPPAFHIKVERPVKCLAPGLIKRDFRRVQTCVGVTTLPVNLFLS